MSARKPGISDSAKDARRDVVAARFAQLQSDLGGLVYEMAQRDHFRLDVLTRRAAELQRVDAELTELEGGTLSEAAPEAPPKARKPARKKPAGSAQR